MDLQNRADLARHLGMKEREIVNVERSDDGTVVTTHDGVRSLVTEDGSVTVVSAPSPALRDPATGAVIRPATPHPAVPQPDGTFSERAATPVEGEVCEACDGTGRKGGLAGDLVATTPAPEVTAAPVEPAGEDQVPDGDAKVVLEWVGEDRDRAERALTAERQRDKPRSTVVDKLERLARP